MAGVGDALLDSVFARRVLGMFNGHSNRREGATSEYSEGGMDGENSKTLRAYGEKDECNDGDAASSALLGIRY